MYGRIDSYQGRVLGWACTSIAFTVLLEVEPLLQIRRGLVELHAEDVGAIGTVGRSEPDDLPRHPDRGPPFREDGRVHAVARRHERVVHHVEAVRGDLRGHDGHPRRGKILRGARYRGRYPLRVLSALDREHNR